MTYNSSISNAQSKIEKINTTSILGDIQHNTSTLIPYGTAGFDFLIGKKSKLTLGAELSNARTKTARQFNTSLPHSNELNSVAIQNNALNVDVIVAMSIGF